MIPAAAAHAKAIAGLQDVLGEHHDAVVAEEWLRSRAEQAGSVAAALAAGMLISAERVDAAERRASWRGTWKAAKAKKVRAWLGS